MKITVQDIIEKKKKKEKIVVLTAYDYAFGRLVDEAGVDIVLVGDSVGNVCLGYESTRPVTMGDMIHHTKAVSRAVKRALLITDMPFGSYQRNPKEAIRNAEELMKEGGAEAVKVEGGGNVIKTVEKMTQAGVQVMGHLGLTPQTAEDYKVKGKTRAAAEQILKEAKKLANAGIFSLVLECIPYQLARLITASVPVPTIGIGAGPFCDGQVLVINDLLGLEKRLKPKFVRTFAAFADEAEKAIAAFKKEVINGSYPNLDESFKMDEAELPGKI